MSAATVAASVRVTPALVVMTLVAVVRTRHEIAVVRTRHETAVVRTRHEHRPGAQSPEPYRSSSRDLALVEHDHAA